MTAPALLESYKEVVMRDAGDTALLLDPDESWKQSSKTHNSHPGPDEAWRQFTKTIPFLRVPPEIHLKIFTFLNPIDAVCLSLVK